MEALKGIFGGGSVLFSILFAAAVCFFVSCAEEEPSAARIKGVAMGDKLFVAVQLIASQSPSQTAGNKTDLNAKQVERITIETRKWGAQIKWTETEPIVVQWEEEGEWAVCAPLCLPNGEEFPDEQYSVLVEDALGHEVKCDFVLGRGDGRITQRD